MLYDSTMGIFTIDAAGNIVGGSRIEFFKQAEDCPETVIWIGKKNYDWDYIPIELTKSQRKRCKKDDNFIINWAKLNINHGNHRFISDYSGPKDGTPDDVICIIRVGLPKCGTNGCTGKWEKNLGDHALMPGNQIVSVRTRNSSKLSHGENSIYVIPNGCVFRIYFKSSVPTESWSKYYLVDQGAVVSLTWDEYSKHI